MLQLECIEAGYAGTTVLRDVSLTVPDRSVVALLGANGAGKTTLLRVGSGLLPPSAGTMLLDGEDVTGIRPHGLARRGVCLVPEGRGIFPGLTVRENLMVQVGQSCESSIDRAIDAFPILGKRLTQVASTMSGGEQQMLALVRAYISNPSLVLLDEVSMGLAPRVVDEIFVFLRRLAAEGVGLLLVEQYVSRALEFADVVYILNRGSVSFCGEPSELEGVDVFDQYLQTAPP